MQLQTLGGLGFDGSDFARSKPLLLLAFVTLEGPQERRYAAELFWQGAADPLNSLSRALSQLRKGAPGTVDADDARLWSLVDSDADAFRAALGARDDEGAVALYRGAFCAGVSTDDLGLELEEWFWQTRERLGREARGALLRLAEGEAARGRFGEAAELAARALELPGAPDPDPELLPSLYTLLRAGEHALAARVRSEADGYGIELDLAPDAARGRLRSSFVGRERERRRLAALAPGQWAWVAGAPGMGKTALLRTLDGTYVPGRAGLPYATLEPLLAQTGGVDAEGGADALLRRLARLRGVWLFDGWSWMDAESRELLRRLRDLRPDATVVIAARESAPLRVDAEIELGPLSEDDLAVLGSGGRELWAASGGLPALVGARLRGEPLEDALEARLAALPEAAADLYLTLATLPEPDPALARRALELDAEAFGGALERLVRAGLADPSGTPRAATAAGDWLAAHPVRAARLALGAARTLDGADAYPLYREALALWEPRDRGPVQRAAAAWAEELLRRGFAERALDALDEALEHAPRAATDADAPEGGRAADGDRLRELRARALERLGRYKEALDATKELPEEPGVRALRAGLLWRLGEPEEAESEAEAALDGPPEARAAALKTLGTLAMWRGNYERAAESMRRSVALWAIAGLANEQAATLNTLGICESHLGNDPGERFAEAMDVAADNVLLKTRIRFNQAMTLEQRGDTNEARTAYLDVTRLAAEVGATATAAWSWNNLGVLYHTDGQRDEASQSYRRALELAREAGEYRLLGMATANLAELYENRDAWEEALRILEGAGHEAEAQGYRDDLPADHPFRQHA